MIHTLPQSLIESAKKILEGANTLNWAVGENSGHAKSKQRSYEKLVWLNAHEVVPKVTPGFRVTPDSPTNHIGDRMQRAITHFNSGKFMDPASVSFDKNNKDFPVFIDNGRHRIAASMVLGKPMFPAYVPHDEVDLLKSHVSVHDEQP